MRKLLVMALLVGGVVVAACDGGKGDDDDDGSSPTPSPTAAQVMVTGSGATPSQTVLFRFKRSQAGGQVFFCVSGQSSAGGAFSLGTNNVPANTYNRVELVINSDGNGVYNMGTDFAYLHTDVVLVTTAHLLFRGSDPAADGWSGGQTPAGNFSWTDGQGCPGG